MYIITRVFFIYLSLSYCLHVVLLLVSCFVLFSSQCHYLYLSVNSFHSYRYLDSSDSKLILYLVSCTRAKYKVSLHNDGPMI